MIVIPITFGGIWIVSLLFTLLGTWLFLRQLNWRPLVDPAATPAPVSISVLKPVKDVDEGLRENLQGFFEQNYQAQYELIFCVADADDPACTIINDLIVRYPAVQARLLIGEDRVGPNPKVNNLIKGYEAAQYNWILISDSNIRVESDYLQSLAQQIDEDVGILTAVVSAQGSTGIGSHLESTYLHTFYARWMVTTSFFGFPCVVGKSMLFRRNVLERVGGLRTLGRYLAEDYMAGQAMRYLNFKVRNAAYSVTQYLGTYSLRAFWSRHIRWGRLRKAHAPIAFLFEPCFGAVGSGLLGTFALLKLFGLNLWPVFFVHVCLWALCDMLLMRRLGQKLSVGTPLMWLLRELLSFPLWLHIAVGNRVNWRGHHLRLRTGGVVETVENETLCLQKIDHSSGVWLPAVTRSRETINTMIGGLGSSRGGAKVEPVLVEPPIIGDDIKKIFA